MYQKADFFDPKIFEDNGDYYLYKIEDEDFSKTCLRKTISDYRVSQGNSKIFLILWGRVLRGAGQLQEEFGYLTKEIYIFQSHFLSVTSKVTS